MNHSCSDEGFVEVRFDGLIVAGADYPPVDTEILWARPISERTFIVDNIPFYVRGIAYMDTIEALPSSYDGVLSFKRVVARSGHSTYRIYWLGDAPQSESDCLAFLRMLEAEGCGFERASGTLYAVDIPPSVSVHHIYEILEKKERENLLDFEEGYYHA